VAPEPEGSSPHSQQPAIGSYLVPIEAGGVFKGQRKIIFTHFINAFTLHHNY
jgi:hypothetical protein